MWSQERLEAPDVRVSFTVFHVPSRKTATLFFGSTTASESGSGIELPHFLETYSTPRILAQQAHQEQGFTYPIRVFLIEIDLVAVVE